MFGGPAGLSAQRLKVVGDLRVRRHMRPLKDRVASVRVVLRQSLYRNSIFLLLTGVINGGFSFLYWVLAARLYSQAQVGQATAIFAAVSITATCGTLGFNNSLIHYLPGAEDRSALLSTAFTVVSVAAMAAGLGFLLLVPLIAGKLDVVRHTALYVLVFEFFVISSSLSRVLDNTFTAYRSAHYTMIRSVLLNIFELTLLVVLVGSGSLGIVASYSFAFVAVALISFGVLRRQFGVELRPRIALRTVRTMASYSLVNYLTTLVSSLPAFVLPLIIISRLGPKSSAIYFVAYNVASVLFLIPLGVANAMFAEASHDEHALRQLLVRAARLTFILLLPAVVALTIFAPDILDLFGPRYSGGGASVLRILGLSGLCFAIVYPCGAILNVIRQLWLLTLVTLCGSVIVLALPAVLISNGAGLTGAAWGWLIGWSATALVYASIVVLVLVRLPSERTPALVTTKLQT